MFRLFFILLIFIPQLSFAQQADFLRLNETGVLSTVRVLEDSSGDRALADILAMQDSFKHSAHVFSGGFTKSAYWFQVTLQRGENSPADWILSAKPATINNLRFYSLNEIGRYDMQQVGSFFTASAKSIDKRLGSYSFKINLKNTAPQVFYLRLQARSAALLQLSVNSITELSQQNIKRKLALGILFGALLMVAIHVLLMWRQVNYAFYIAFVGYIIASVINIILVEGGFIDFWSPNYPRLSSLLQDISFCSFVIFKAIFFIYFFDTKRHYPAVHKVFLVFIGIVCLTILVTPFDVFTDIAPIVVVLMIITTTIQLYIAWRTDCSSRSAGCFVFWGFAVYFVVFIITLLATIGVVWVDPVGILATRIILFVLLIFIGLHKNFQNLQREQEETKQAKEKAENQIEAEKNRNEERSHFLNLVAHEIKTPLATIDSAIQVIQTYSASHSEMIEERYRRVRLSVMQLNSLLENILTAERDENLPFHVDSQSIILKNLIQNLVAEQVSATQQFIVTMDSGLECRADRNLLKLALSNVLKNAVKYSPQNSTINCYAQKATRINTRGVFLTISSHYLVNQEPDIKLWFNKYYKETKTNDQSSLGLGLFLVKKIFKAHGGDIDCVLSQEKDCWRVSMNIWLPDIIPSQTND